MAWEARTAAAAHVEAEGEVATGLASLSKERVLVRDMAAMTGIEEAVCSRLLKSPPATNGTPAPTTGREGDVDAVG